jgi:archaellin
MSKLIMLIIALTVTLVLISGCTYTSELKTPSTTTISQSTISTTIPPTVTSKGVQHSTTNILLKGSIYGTAADTNAGIDGIRFTIGLVSGAPSIDITKMQIVYSTASVSPILMTYTSGTPTVSSTFYASQPSMATNDQVNIWFTIPPAPKNTVMNIEIRPGGGGAAIPFSKTVPLTINPVNVLP